MTKPGFGIWITGLPASGKTAISEAVMRRLDEWYGTKIVHLDSDSLRKILTPEPTYSLKERDWFYSVMTYIGQMLTTNGINVIFDATANRRSHRDKARSLIRNFMEVYAKCPIEECIARDPKGLYRMAKEGKASTVPGIQEVFEEPESPDLIIETNRVSPEEGAEHLLARMKEKGWV